LPGNHRAALLWRAELRRNRGRVAVESENGQLALSKCLDRLCVIAKKIFPSERLFTV
jgi:hypothetical protein